MITLKNYQNAAVQNALEIYRYVAGQLRQVEKAVERAAVVSHNGGVLLKAPTGSGKTLVAGEIAQGLSLEEKVVWFWFAPFKGLVGQTESSLRDRTRLRVRNLRDDRMAAGSKSGDVWVSTWQSVATRDTDGRKIRSDSESNFSLDALLVRLREDGFHIGVVVDEAHHGFGHGTQALEFYSQVIRPEFTLLLTATPDDADAEAFKRAAGFQRLHPITISRQDAVEAGLVKPSVRSIAFVADGDQKNAVDFERTALREGMRTHGAVKAGLKEAGIDLVPLMLVQVDSSEGSVDRAKKTLLEMGFTEEQIAVHTAKEPDSNLLALAVDESKEVLIFKMAVALGFDAPRAFTLVSMRGIADADFGTQIVGRLMRVHSRCQGVDLPPLLQSAYVFLADCEAQKGLSEAAQKVNRIKTELAQVSLYAVVVHIAGQNQLQIIKNGQPYLLPSEKQLPQEFDTGARGGELEANEVRVVTQLEWLDLLAEAAGTAPSGGKMGAGRTESGEFPYSLKEGVLPRFLTQRMRVVDGTGMAGGIAEHLKLTDDILEDGMRQAVSVIRVDQSVFTDSEDRSRVEAEMALEQTEEEAQRMLFNMGTVDARDLQECLLERLRKEYQKRGKEIADDEDQLDAALALILVQYPELLRKARKACEAQYTEVVEAGDLPPAILSERELDRSPKNIYGVYPPDLNTWERAFAEWLDNDVDGVVKWWHRNLPDKDWSVAVTLPNGCLFFPDFLIGIEGRDTPDSVLLVDTKRGINDDVNALAKAVSAHQKYGQTLILFYEDRKRWKVVRYNEEKDKNEVAEKFELKNAKDF